MDHITLLKAAVGPDATVSAYPNAPKQVPHKVFDEANDTFESEAKARGFEVSAPLK
jgi:hypothetical protein